MTRRSSAIVLSVFLMFILTACGGTNNPSTSIAVTMTDFAFMPNTFTVPAGQQITLSANNNGAVDHSFLIMRLGHEVKAHFTAADQANVYWEQKVISSGQSAQVTFTSPSEPGVYQIVCGNGGHFEAGMVAQLVVVSQP